MINHSDTAASAGSGKHEYRLGYGLWQCDHCGSRFVAMAGCQECRKDGPQADAAVDERQAMVGRVRPLLDVAEPHGALELESFRGILSEWLDDLYTALAKVGERKPDAEQHLTSAVRFLANLRVAAAASPHRRPLVSVWREVERVLNRLEGLANANLDALEAPTPELAERHQARAQEFIDAAGTSAHAFDRLIERLGIPTRGSFFDAFADDTADAYRQAKAESLTDFDTKGASIYARITGGAEYPRGLGVSLMLIEAKVEESFDADRFQRDVRAAFIEFVRQPIHLDALIADPDWRAEVSRASRELFSAAVEIFDLANGSVRHQWFETRAALRLGLLLAEGVAPIYLRTLLTLRRRHHWKRYRGNDAGQLLKEVRDAGLGDLTEGIDIGIRDADAHRAYVQLEDGIALAGRRNVLGREMSGDELLDLVLAATESCVLLHTALICAMTSRGVPVEGLEAASDLIPKAEQVRVLMSAAGLREVSVEATETALTIRGSGSLEANFVLSAAAAVAAIEPEGQDYLRFIVADGDGSEWQAEGPIEPFDRFRDSDGAARECATVEAAARWIVRGERVFSRAYVRRWSAIRAGQAVQTDRKVTLDLLTDLAQLAQRLGDDRLRQTLNAYARLVRARRAGLAPPKRDIWSSEQMVEWMNDASGKHGGPLTT